MRYACLSMRRRKQYACLGWFCLLPLTSSTMMPPGPSGAPALRCVLRCWRPSSLKTPYCKPCMPVSMSAGLGLRPRQPSLPPCCAWQKTAGAVIHLAGTLLRRFQAKAWSVTAKPGRTRHPGSWPPEPGQYLHPMVRILSLRQPNACSYVHCTKHPGGGFRIMQ